MKYHNTFAAFLTAAMLITSAGCTSAESAQGAAAAQTTTVSEARSLETVVIDGKTYYAETTVGNDAQSQFRDANTTAPYRVGEMPGESDIVLDAHVSSEDGVLRLTPEMKWTSFTVKYVGQDECFYTTGEDFRLDKLVDGEWVTVPFSKKVYWNEIAYEVSKHSSPEIVVSLEDNMYEERLTVGQYRVVKNVSGREFSFPLEIISLQDAIAPIHEAEEENGYIKLNIVDIEPERFVCQLTFPHPNKYFVMCDTANYPDLCAGDDIDIDFSVMYRLTNGVYEVHPTSIEFSPRPPLDPSGTTAAAKPVIYLYPEEPAQVDVRLDYNGDWTLAIPRYENGWTVTAYPDGRLIQEGREYPYLFWEGRNAFSLDTSKGFCVSGTETEQFLLEKLAYLGLNERETAEFLDYWLPLMQDNSYNIITFAGADYTDNAALDISPVPDTVIRVFMVFAESDVPVDIEPQELAPAPERSGFTVVEWGGAGK